MQPISCTNTHDITYLLNYGIAKNAISNVMRTEQLFYKVKRFLNCASDDTFREVIVL